MKLPTTLFADRDVYSMHFNLIFAGCVTRCPEYMLPTWPPAERSISSANRNIKPCGHCSFMVSGLVSYNLQVLPTYFHNPTATLAQFRQLLFCQANTQDFVVFLSCKIARRKSWHWNDGAEWAIKHLPPDVSTWQRCNMRLSALLSWNSQYMNTVTPKQKSSDTWTLDSRLQVQLEEDGGSSTELSRRWRRVVCGSMRANGLRRHNNIMACNNNKLICLHFHELKKQIQIHRKTTGKSSEEIDQDCWKRHASSTVSPYRTGEMWDSRRCFSRSEMPIHVNWRLQSKPPMFIDWASKNLYSNVVSSMTSITGTATTVRFSATRLSSGCSHPATTKLHCIKFKVK